MQTRSIFRPIILLIVVMATLLAGCQNMGKSNRSGTAAGATADPGGGGGGGGGGGAGGGAY
jgi:hypothetical protein